MAEPEATNQDGETPKPEAAPRIDLSADRKRRSSNQVSTREWQERRKEERRTAAEKQAKPEALSPDPDSEPPTDLSHEDQGSEDGQTTEAAAIAPEAEAAESEADEGYFPESLSEFAEALGVDPKDFMQGVTTTVRAGGVDHTVPLKDLLESYASKSERDSISNALLDERKAFQAQVEQHQAEYQTRIQQADAMLDALKASIDSGPDEAALSQMLSAGQIDERQYLTARANRDAQKAKFNEIVEQRNATAQEEHAKFREAQQKMRVQEQEALLAWKPELREPTALSDFQNRFRGNLTKHYGLTNEQVDQFFQTYSLPQVQIVNDAIAYQELKAKEKPIRQKLHTLPKLQKAGAKRTASQQANDAVLGARSRLKSSGTPQDAIALLRARRAQRNQSHGGSQ